ncbi:MAG: hypothetical protein OXE49_01465 [Gemmatimonadetes bacterium]|nr:hypothetical protein [Gemmatimonadota bacterium]
MAKKLFKVGVGQAVQRGRKQRRKLREKANEIRQQILCISHVRFYDEDLRKEQQRRLRQRLGEISKQNMEIDRKLVALERQHGEQEAP